MFLYIFHWPSTDGYMVVIGTSLDGALNQLIKTLNEDGEEFYWKLNNKGRPDIWDGDDNTQPALTFSKSVPVRKDMVFDVD